MKKLLLFVCGALAAGRIAALPVFTFEPPSPKSFDAEAPGITLKVCRLDNPERGITVMAVLRRTKTADSSRSGQARGTIVQRDKQFLFGFDQGKIYLDLHDGQGWNNAVSAPLPRDDRAFHAVAVTARRINDVTQGDNYLQVKLYFDGELLLSRNLTKGAVPDSSFPVTVARHLGGELADARGFNRVLSLAEIQKYGANFDRIRKKDRGLSDKDEELLAQLPQKDCADFLLAAGSALRNLAAGNASFDWRGAARAVAKAAKERAKELPTEANLRQYKIKNAVLTVTAAPGTAAAVSLYDTLARRELLCPDNPWFRVGIGDRRVSPLDGEFSSELKILGKDKFRLTWKSPDLTAEAAFDCGDYLAYTLEVRPVRSGTTLQAVEFPALELRPLSGDGTLFSPVMSGIAQPEAIKNKKSFECTYPRAFGAMQYGAFYDSRSGVYWSSADPLARVKMLYHTTAADRIKVRYQWTPTHGKPFLPECGARLAVFSGHWYDAAMLYRRQIWEIKARWLPEKGLPRTDVASWFRDNPFWGSLNIVSADDLHGLKAMRRYLGLPFAVMLYRWNALVWDRDYPHHKSQPEYLDALDECHRLGVRAVPYINGRLWEEKDRREHDYLYSKLGKPNCVKNADGTIASSVFNGKKFGIICPCTEIYDKMMQTACRDALLPGADGVYVDQIGAAAHILCYDPAHGHAVPDDTSWFVKGHDKVFSRIRAEFKARNPNSVFTTEDNAETCVRNFDGLDVWRWTCDHQVPAFPAVYSGYSQFYGISFNRRHPEAFPAILAWQFVTSCQPGGVSPTFFTDPAKHDFRVWAMRLIRLRIALLDFFNAGIMARPAEFAKPIPSKRLRWGDLGTAWVTTPDIYTCSWSLDGMLAVSVLNIAETPRGNTIRFSLPGKGKYTLYRFSAEDPAEKTSAVSGSVETAVSLAPRSFELLLAVPEGKDAKRQLDRIRGQFGIIARLPSEKDPFVAEKNSPMAVREEETGFLRIDGGHFRCLFMRGSMFPIRFMTSKYETLGKMRWADRIRIDKRFYSLYVDRHAEQKIVENTPDRLVIVCSGTMCSRGREEEPPVPVKAVYTYTFVRNRKWVDVASRLEIGDGTAQCDVPELLAVSCGSLDGRLKVEADKMNANSKVFTRTGKIIVK